MSLFKTDIPGFIDLQVNGYKGTDFSGDDLNPEKFADTCRELLNAGTAAFLATVITSPEEIYRKNLQIISAVMDDPEFKNRLPGIHLEGPFISNEPGYVGAHNPLFVKKPDTEFLKQLIEWADGKIKLLTIAAELAGAEKLTKAAVQNGITVSIGHSNASSDDLKRISDAGAESLTHFGNGIPNLLPRHENILWAGLREKRLTAMLISDGHHLPPPMLKTIVELKGENKIIVVSDGSPLTGMPPGEYNCLGNDVILEENGKLHNPQKKCLVGSSSSMFQCMNYLSNLGIMKYDEQLAAGFYNPLKLIKTNPADIKSDHQLFYHKKEKRFALT